MILMLPLGVIYFSVFITLIALALGFMAAPVAQLFISFPIVSSDQHTSISTPDSGVILFLVGFAVALGTLHLAKLVGRWHGSLAKAMLVSE